MIKNRLARKNIINSEKNFRKDIYSKRNMQSHYINAKNKYECENCKKRDFDNLVHSFDSNLKLVADHIIPYEISLDDSVDNIQYICENCHSIKTNLDKSIINLFKILGFIETVGNETIYYVSKEQLIEIYKYIYTVHKNTPLESERK